MSGKRLGTDDYPLAERQPEEVRTRSGLGLEAVTMEAVLSGRLGMADLQITPQALRQQAEIACAAGRPALATNFERAAELVDVPQALIIEIYELLRPGRARAKAELLAAAERLRREHGAVRMADFVAEAAEVYERRGLFTYRF